MAEFVEDLNALFAKANALNAEGNLEAALETYDALLLHPGMDQQTPLLFNRAVTIGGLGQSEKVRTLL